MIVTIDGPAGAGKSTAARRLAAKLEFDFLDTGAMYRAVALAGIRAGIALTDDVALEQLLESLWLEMPPGRVLLGGEDVSDLIRTPEISIGSSVVAVSAVVRPWLVTMQRAIAQGRNMVCEGRDQGTVVFPDALCKFFLTANAEERLQRRVRELRARGETVDIDALRRTQAERDERDSKRELSPLRPAEDAVLIDSTHLDADHVVVEMERIVRSRMTF